ncbi:hypothetical protein [Shewanella sp. S23-S33]|uniref:hypothetical protein n=1 Tax=Shewanella sp. S23-S33 TaxID=3342769 RepID=UPI00372D6CFA
MLMTDELRAAINDIWANEARHPERIYLGISQRKRLMKDVSFVENTELSSTRPSYIRIKITKEFDGVRIYDVNEEDHFHVC